MKGKRWILLGAFLLLALALMGTGLYAKKQHDDALAAQAEAIRLAQEQAAAAQAAAEQAQKQAEEAAAQAAAEKAAREEAERQQAVQAAADATQAAIEVGDRIGTVWVEGTDLNCDLYWGDGSAIFRKGAGCSAENDCVLPGENGTVFVGGHTDSWFVDLKSAEIGAIIHLDTIYGNFEYQITEDRIIYDTEVDQCRWGDTAPSCILYTCYPFGIQVPTNQRYLVYADPVQSDANGVVPSSLPELADAGSAADMAESAPAT